jgi:Domain of unknown function (DUF4062)
MKKKLQVFVSSTYTDMKAERQAAVEAILDAGHIPAGMELFASENKSQLETIHRWIDDSDVFMLILGGRYGTVESESGKSYTQLEYEYAIETNKPLFAAVIDESYLNEKVKANGVDVIEKINGKLLSEFREIVTSKTSRFFNSEDKLKLIIMNSLNNFERDEDLVGWVRGNEVVDPKSTLAEMNRIQEENIFLRKQVDEFTEFSMRSTPGKLGKDAKILLIAAKNHDGYIVYGRYIGASSIEISNKNFIEPPDSTREEVRWKAAIDELYEEKLVEQVEHSKSSDIFRLTKRGYEVGDEIEAKSGETAALD